MNVPIRSRLFQIEPRGLNSPYVESLTSYIKRHAASLNVSVGTFVKTTISTEINQSYLVSDLHRGASRLYQRAATINGAHQLSLLLSSVLEGLTLIKDLRELTLLSWSNKISTLNLFKPSLYWCPHCFLDWSQKNEVLYEPLHWSINGVTICPIHLDYLKGKCPHCYSTQPILSHYCKIGICSKCNHTLGNGKYTEEKPSSLEINASSKVFSVLFINQSQTPNSLFKDLIDNQWNGLVSHASEAMNISFSTMWGWYTHQYFIPIPRLYELIKSMQQIQTPSMAKSLGTININSNRKFIQSQYDDIKVNLISCLNKNPPLSLDTVSKYLKVSRKTLHKYFPEITKQIKTRYSNYRSTHSQLRIQSICEEIQSGVAALVASGIYPGARTLEKHLIRPSLIRRPEFRDAWRQAKHTYGCSGSSITNKVCLRSPPT